MRFSKHVKSVIDVAALKNVRKKVRKKVAKKSFKMRLTAAKNDGNLLKRPKKAERLMGSGEP
ncbi:MAG: hypothetical protein ACOX7B_12335 [Christensenellales bacterium]